METRRTIQSNACFRGFNTSRKRYVIAWGGAGSGKSMNCALKQIADLSNPANSGMNLLCVRKNLDSHKDSTRAELIRAINTIFGDNAGDVWHIPEASLTLTCKTTGNIILFRGMKDQAQRDKLKSVSVESGTIQRAWIEEATDLTPLDFDLVDSRLRGKLPDGTEPIYQIYMTFNPVSATHWIKRRFFDLADNDVYSTWSNYETNRFIDDATRRKYEKDKANNPEFYKIYGAGEWGESGGLIFTNWVAEDLSQDLDSYDAITMGQDFGFNHANAILLLGWRDGEVYVLREIYVRDMVTGDIIELAKAADLPKKIPMFCDSAEPDRIREWQRAGFRAIPVDKGAGKATSGAIAFLKDRKIHIDKRCTNTIEEISAWEWIRDRTTGAYTDEVTPVNDDAMAALRYGTEPWRIAGGARKRRKI